MVFPFLQQHMRVYYMQIVVVAVKLRCRTLTIYKNKLLFNSFLVTGCYS